MAKNLVKKEFFTDCTWTAPAGVTEVLVTPVYEGFKAISAGLNNTGVLIGSQGFITGLDDSGLAYTWGAGTDGQLGDGTIVGKCSPVRVCCNYRFKAISVGDNHAVALDESGFAYAWGFGGRLGDGTITARCQPVRVCCNYRYKAISAGSLHTMALDENGFAYGWATANTCGRIGDGTITARCQPVRVCCDYKFKAISAGNLHTVALDENGFAYAWGANSSGQLGDGTLNNRCQPVRVCCDYKFKAISAGLNNTTVAIDENGFAYAWGSGSAGALGDGTTTNKSQPVRVCCDYKFKAISAGGSIIALDENGFAYTWGSGTSGRLGDGTITNKCQPVRVCCNYRYKAISAGNGMAAIDENGFAYTWGWGSSGQGDGTITARCQPVRVCCNYIHRVIDDTKIGTLFQVIPNQSYNVKIFGVMAGFNSNPLLPGHRIKSIVLKYWA